MARAQLAQLIPVTGMLMVLSAMSQPMNLNNLSSLSRSREVDLFEGRFDLVQGGRLIPLHGDLFFLGVSFHLGDSLDIPQLSLDRHDTVSTIDVWY
jgi:hypothetical protein